MDIAAWAQLLGIAAFVIGVIAIPAVIAISSTWRARRAEARLALAEQELCHLRAELGEHQQHDLGRRGMRPLADPPAGIMPIFQETVRNWPSDPLCFPIGWARIGGTPTGIYTTFEPTSDQFAGNIR